MAWPPVQQPPQLIPNYAYSQGGGSGGSSGGGGGPNGPAFRAYQSVGQALAASTQTKLTFTTEVFDTDGAYDVATSRFQPNVAGYYYFTAAFATSSPNTSHSTAVLVKNGVNEYAGVQTTNTTYHFTVSGLIYLNGTSDYVEAHGVIFPALTTATGRIQTYFDGHLARAA